MTRPKTETNSYHARKVDSTDVVLWVWPHTTVFIQEGERNKRALRRTTVSIDPPPHCRIYARVYMAMEKGRKSVDLIQILEVQTLNGFLPAVPSWVDDILITEFIDDELKLRFPEEKVNKISTAVIDREVSKLRAIQSNYTFITPSRIQSELERPLVSTG